MDCLGKNHRLTELIFKWLTYTPTIKHAEIFIRRSNLMVFSTELLLKTHSISVWLLIYSHDYAWQAIHHGTVSLTCRRCLANLAEKTTWSNKTVFLTFSPIIPCMYWESIVIVKNSILDFLWKRPFLRSSESKKVGWKKRLMSICVFSLCKPRASEKSTGNVFFLLKKLAL